jgi:RNA polymerase subunit RPABC4/transcription elongation factor Spt4
MRAKRLTEPKKKKCSNCQGDLPNTENAPPIKSDETKLEICPECKVNEILGAFRSRNVEI